MRISLAFVIPASLGAASLWDSSAVPAQIDSRDPSSIEVGVKFTSDVSGAITAIRFYKSIPNAGSHVGNLWNVAGTNLGTVVFANESPSGWQQMSFTTPIPVQAGATYVASYFAPAGRYSATIPFFAAPLDVPPLHASTGVFRYTAQSAAPTSTFQGNFWVDVVFTTGAPPPPPPPPPPPTQTVKVPSIVVLVVQ